MFNWNHFDSKWSAEFGLIRYLWAVSKELGQWRCRDTIPYHVQYKYDLDIVRSGYFFLWNTTCCYLKDMRYEGNFLDSYGSCEQKLRTQWRCRDTTPYNVQYKYDLYIVKSGYFFLWNTTCCCLKDMRGFFWTRMVAVSRSYRLNGDAGIPVLMMYSINMSCTLLRSQ